MIELIYIVIMTFLIALLAFVGIFTLAMKDHLLNKILLILISLSAGVLMGGAFIHLLPEAIEGGEGSDILVFVLVGFILFFILEKVLHWRHCHDGKCDVHTFHYMNLIGDSIHNFIDGLIGFGNLFWIVKGCGMEQFDVFCIQPFIDLYQAEAVSIAAEFARKVAGMFECRKCSQWDVSRINPQRLKLIRFNKAERIFLPVQFRW